MRRIILVLFVLVVVVATVKTARHFATRCGCIDTCACRDAASCTCLEPAQEESAAA